jgi:phage baseplate assembly protein V
MVDLLKMATTAMEPLRQRILLAVGRAVISASNDSKRAMELQLEGLNGEIMDQAQQILAYGFTSRVLDGDAAGQPEAVFVCVGGNRDHPVVVGTEDRRHRPKGTVSKGEVVLYDDQGSSIRLERGKRIFIEVADSDTAGELQVSAGTLNLDCDQANLNAPNGTTIVGSLTVTIDVSDATGSMQAMRDTYNGHTHSETSSTTLPPDQPM